MGSVPDFPPVTGSGFSPDTQGIGKCPEFFPWCNVDPGGEVGELYLGRRAVAAGQDGEAEDGEGGGKGDGSRANVLSVQGTS
jgi:hypothetical protein